MPRELKPVVTGMSYMEGPRWHDGRMWFSDFYTHRVYSVNEDGSDQRVELEVPNQPSGIGWLPDGSLVAVSMRDRKILRRTPNGEVVVHADLSDHVTGHPNDMVVDNKGRIYVGNFGFDLMGGAPVSPTVLLRVDLDGSVHEVADDLWFPNGSVITPEGVLIVNETMGNRATAFDIAEDGSLTNRREWFKFAELPTETYVADGIDAGQYPCGPDGSCLDAEGGLWIADAMNGRVLRVLEGGEVTEEIDPGTGVFACGLGGADGKTLYLCTAPDFFEDKRSAAREAVLMATKVDVPAAT
ncbi:SMP-30/gluconolactonase/LRE family protein (plasmid) [Xanthobacter dioxanivorans]|uniref:SMP-30/gluconolactonase/LRE family protein n=2 Tax=Xanthobacteraceae TaxID=335928 RepID=A0A974SM15_9HYPH|nr:MULTISPECIES: SMP-30/gluconolactonase/LRE family protein [Xanthobacteraceae]QRG09939.1 SMP-30/gluconolactonase/LRE family protein [Xanthobacter dioxanivorans]UOK73458.1 SMP-30/gluconolactonase/LRE family protein [Ancylobacter polymorphus]